MSDNDPIAGLLALHEAGRFDELLESARAMAADHPNLPVLHSLIGAAHAERGEYGEAVAAIRRAVDIDPGNAPAHYNLGSVLMRMDRAEDAAASFRRAAELSPDRAEFHHALGLACYAAGQFDDAAAAGRDAIRLDPGNAGYAKALAEYLMAQSLDLEALEVLQRAAAAAPDDQDVHVVLGEAFVRQRRYDDALRAFHTAATLKPDDADLFLRVAQFWGRHNVGEKELEALERAIRIDPDNPQAQVALGHALLEQGRRDEAIEVFERGLALEPGNAEARHLLAAARGETPPAPPPDYVAELFDDYAPTFERSLLTELDYRAPHQVAAMLARHAPRSGTFGSVLDLGCGTGLFGIEFRAHTRQLVGVDLSPKMVAAARRKQVYDRLEVGDIVDMIEAEPKAHDAYAAVDVLIYVGALEAVFDAIASSANAGTLFAFSTEHSPDGTYLLRESGRYAHSRQYIENLCAARGFRLVAAEFGPLRKERARIVDGGIYLLAV